MYSRIMTKATAPNRNIDSVIMKGLARLSGSIRLEVCPEGGGNQGTWQGSVMPIVLGEAMISNDAQRRDE